jgi:hypothetical protein
LKLSAFHPCAANDVSLYETTVLGCWLIVLTAIPCFGYLGQMLNREHHARFAFAVSA